MRSTRGPGPVGLGSFFWILLEVAIPSSLDQPSSIRHSFGQYFWAVLVGGKASSPRMKVGYSGLSGFWGIVSKNTSPGSSPES